MIADRRLYPSLAIASLCLVAMILPFKVGFGDGVPYGPLLYHLFHANLFHLAANFLGLYYFKPRWSTITVSYVIATAVAFCPLTWMDDPTYGLSALLFAAYARKYAGFRIKLWPLVVITGVTAFVPGINWRIHAAAFLLSYLTWRIYYAYFFKA